MKKNSHTTLTGKLMACLGRLVLWPRLRYHKMMIWLYVGDLGNAHPQERVEAYNCAEKHFEAIERLEQHKTQNPAITETAQHEER